MRLGGRLYLAISFAALGVTAFAGLPAFNPADADHGKALSDRCMACHGAANPPVATNPPFHPPKLAGQRPEAIFYALRDYKSGARQSPFMGPQASTLSLQDMRDLGAYLSAGGPHRPLTADEHSWAHDKVHRDCTACHGESGMGVMAGIPVLTGQNKDYLIHALTAYHDGTRTNPTMRGVAAKLSPQDIEALATYFSDQKHLRLSQ